MHVEKVLKEKKKKRLQRAPQESLPPLEIYLLSYAHCPPFLFAAYTLKDCNIH